MKKFFKKALRNKKKLLSFFVLLVLAVSVPLGMYFLTTERSFDERSRAAGVACGSLHSITFSYETQSWPSGTFCADGHTAPLYPSFPAPGSTTNWQCYRFLSDGTGEADIVDCFASRESSSSEMPACGTLNGLHFSYETQSWPSGSFCSAGFPAPIEPAFPSPGSTTQWECYRFLSDGTGEALIVDCSASRQSAPSNPPSCGALDGRNFAYETQSWPSDDFCTEGHLAPLYPSFPAPGSSTSWQCYNFLSDGTGSALIADCSASRDSPPETPPSCGTLSGIEYTYETRSWPSGTFCSSGYPYPSNPSFPVIGGTTNWQCHKFVSGTSDVLTIDCTASRDSTPSIMPSCGLRSGTYSYDTADWYSGSFCSEGTPEPLEPVFPDPGGSVTWNCTTETDSVSCLAERYPEPEEPPGEYCNDIICRTEPPYEICFEGICLRGDVDNNGLINVSDFSLFKADFIAFKENGWSYTLARSDFNEDGRISMADYSIFVKSYRLVNRLDPLY